MIKNNFIFFIFLFIFSFDALSKEKNASFELNGYLKYLPSLMNYSFFDSEFKNLIHNRINSRGNFGENLTLGFELRNRLIIGDSPQLQDDNGLVDMSFNLINDKNIVFNTMIDRFWIKYQKEKLEIIIGRQRVNWGVNTIWNNNDLFNAYNFIDFDYIERPGSDVVRLIYTGDNLTSFEIVYMPKKRFSIGNVFAGMYKFNFYKYDFQILAANYYEDFVLGSGWAGNFFNAGFKGEISYFFDKNKFKNSLSLSSSIDYSTKKGWYFLASYLLNSNGFTESNFLSLININNNIISAKNLMPSKHSYLIQISKSISPPVNASMSILYGQGIKLLFLSPNISYEINSRVDAGLIGQFFYLDNFGDFKNILKGYFLQMRYSF